MKFRPRQEIGTISWEPSIYGRSHLGSALEVWRPNSRCDLLIHAGIHGEEAETTLALSRALRLLAEPSPNCAVVLAVNPDGLTRGTRGNARGVDLNRNFPTQDWKPDPVEHRSTLEDPRDVRLSPGSGPGSEPEIVALVRLIDELQPQNVVALHAPLACIDDAKQGPLARWLAERTGLALVADVGYPTPGSFGTWGGEHGIGVVTYEFPLTTTDALVREHVPVLADLLAGEISWS
jgi:murein peptide amidase A